MSAIFSVAAKLLGVILTYLGLLHILTALLLGGGEKGPVLLQLLSGAVAWVLAFVLVFRTDTFARFVRVDANAPAPPVSFESTSVLRTGIVLVGLYVFATRITLALSIASMYVSGVRF